MKNDIILFLVMLVVALVGFNIITDQLGSKETAVDPPEAVDPFFEDQLATTLVDAQTDAPVVSGSGSSNIDSDDGSDGDIEERQVKTMLKNRADAWNARNLSLYMADYRKFDSLRVSFKGESRKGWDEVSDFFASKFRPDMGTLRISNMKIHMVGDYASIVGADWNLQQRNKVTNGRMNLVMKKIDAAWRITTETLDEK